MVVGRGLPWGAPTTERLAAEELQLPAATEAVLFGHPTDPRMPLNHFFQNVTFPRITTITNGCFRERRSGRWNDHNGAKQTAQSVPSFVLEWWKLARPAG